MQKKTISTRQANVSVRLFMFAHSVPRGLDCFYPWVSACETLAFAVISPVTLKTGVGVHRFSLVSNATLDITRDNLSPEFVINPLLRHRETQRGGFEGGSSPLREKIEQ